MMAMHLVRGPNTGIHTSVYLAISLKISVTIRRRFRCNLYQANIQPEVLARENLILVFL